MKKVNPKTKKYTCQKCGRSITHKGYCLRCNLTFKGVKMKSGKEVKKILSQIKKLAREVYGELGSGFDEKVYQRAMEVSLRLAKIRYENQKVVELKFKDHYVGEGYPDLIVDLNGIKIVLELKAIGKLGGKEEAQIRSYMKILKIPYGLLINFQSPGADIKKETQLEIREISL